MTTEDFFIEVVTPEDFSTEVVTSDAASELIEKEEDLINKIRDLSAFK